MIEGMWKNKERKLNVFGNPKEIVISVNGFFSVDYQLIISYFVVLAFVLFSSLISSLSSLNSIQQDNNITYSYDEKSIYQLVNKGKRQCFVENWDNLFYTIMNLFLYVVKNLSISCRVCHLVLFEECLSKF